jgi:hypothetical protein
MGLEEMFVKQANLYDEEDPASVSERTVLE